MTDKPDGQTYDLIDFESSESDTVQLRKKTATAEAEETVKRDVTDAQKPESKRNYGRLCGYLNKLGNRGILKTSRRRWFVFSEDNCKLYYYRSPNDTEPVGEIDISKATFSFDVSNKERTGLFNISVPGKDYFLEASNRQACLFWLQELQKFRRANSLLRTQQIQKHSSSGLAPSMRPQSGLLGSAATSCNDLLLAGDGDEAQLMAPVDCPADVVGEESSFQSSAFAAAQQKLNNLRLQVTKSHKFYAELPSPEREDTTFKEKHNSGVSFNNSTFFTDIDIASPVKEPSSAFPPSPTKNKSQGFSMIRSRISGSFRKAHSAENEVPNPGHTKFPRSLDFKHPKVNEEVESLTDEVSSLQDELAASRTLIKDLKLQLDTALKDKESLMDMCKTNTEPESLDILNLKNKQVVSLTYELLDQKQQTEKLQHHILSLKKEITDLQQQNSLFEELLQEKDKIIVSLTNEVFDLETEKKDKQKDNSSGSLTSVDMQKSTESLQDVTDLKVAVQAFELQNKFLNKEILELNQLISDSEERELALSMKCSEWEARCCQIQSKLLYLLSELNKPDAAEKSREIVSRLLNEAMADSSSAEEGLPFWSIENVYDDLGFNYRWGKDDILPLKAANLRQRSEDIANKAKEDAEMASWRVKWDSFIVSVGSRELQRSPELKALLRQGIPREYKGRIWKGLVDMRVMSVKMRLGPQYYESLLDTNEVITKLDPSCKQIELDLLRTLPNNKHYENRDSEGIMKLRRVLLAYSRHDPIVGYCQGLNRLAAIALLFMDEEDSFWCLVAIVRYLMPKDYYTRTLIASQVDQRVLKDLMADKLPRLHTHFEQFQVDLSLFTFNWFLTVFVDNIPVETYLRIWDVFLYEGSKVLFRYALAFFKYCENDILMLKDYISINRYLQGMAEKMTDMKRISQIAFGDLNPFPQRVITAKREHHMNIVKAQLEEMEAIRNSFPRNIEKINIEYPSEED